MNLKAIVFLSWPRKGKRHQQDKARHRVRKPVRDLTDREKRY